MWKHLKFMVMFALQSHTCNVITVGWNIFPLYARCLLNNFVFRKAIIHLFMNRKNWNKKISTQHFFLLIELIVIPSHKLKKKLRLLHLSRGRNWCLFSSLFNIEIYIMSIQFAETHIYILMSSDCQDEDKTINWKPKKNNQKW